jgi:drug/metabolite transporter (DMT)-like permease
MSLAMASLAPDTGVGAGGDTAVSSNRPVVEHSAGRQTPETRSNRRRGLILAVSSAVAFGISGVVSKAAMLGAGPALTPSALAQFRITGAALVLLLVVAVRRRSFSKIRWDLPAVIAVLAYGVLAFLVMQTLYFAAIRRLNVGVALLIEYLAPALVAAYALLVQRRPQARSTWYGIAAALAGLALIARPWQAMRLDTLGVLAALGAAGALAAAFLLGESTQRRMAGPQLAAAGAGVAAVLIAAIQPWGGFPWAVLGNATTFHLPVWALLVVIVLVGTVLAYLAGIAALRHLPAPIAAVVATLEVIVAAFVAWVLLGENLTVWELGGGTLLLAGAVTAQRGARPT